MFKSIILEDMGQHGLSISEQLRDNGIHVSDSNFKEAYLSVFQIFAKEAASYYEVVAQGTYEHDSDRKCGLCGNKELITYYVVQNKLDEPLKTQHSGKHFGFDFELTWPDTIRLGSHCVKLLDISMEVPRMVNSMLDSRIRFTRTSGGLVMIGSIIKNYKHWAYDRMVIPHALFTRLPKYVLDDSSVGISDVVTLNTPVDLRDCTEKSIQRSFYASTRGAKYGVRKYLSYPSFCPGYSEDTPLPYLATVMHRNTAERIFNKYFKH